MALLMTVGIDGLSLSVRHYQHLVLLPTDSLACESSCKDRPYTALGSCRTVLTRSARTQMGPLLPSFSSQSSTLAVPLFSSLSLELLLFLLPPLVIHPGIPHLNLIFCLHHPRIDHIVTTHSVHVAPPRKRGSHSPSIRDSTLPFISCHVSLACSLSTPELPAPVSLASPRPFRRHSYKGQMSPCRPCCLTSLASLRRQEIQSVEFTAVCFHATDSLALLQYSPFHSHEIQHQAAFVGTSSNVYILLASYPRM